MKFPSRQPSVRDLPGVTGTVRLDRRTSSLLRRLHPGDIAVIDQVDMDHAQAEALRDCQVVAVVNASPFISGRYPNLGPELLSRSGIVLLEDVGSDVFSNVHDGGSARIHQGTLFVGEQVVATGRELSAEQIVEMMDQARGGLSTQLQSFTHNTTEFLRHEQDLLLHGRGLPKTRTRFAGRPVVVVVRGYDYEADLKVLRRYVREQRPILVGVDGGADALLTAGHRPDLVVVGSSALEQHGGGASGSGHAISDKGLRMAREVVLHVDGSGSAGAERLERLGVTPKTLTASVTTEDLALLLADLSGASLLVTVGTHATFEEFLDRQRSGLASVFLTRLRVGPKLVGARSVAQLYAGRVRLWHLVVVLLAGLLALGIAIAATPVGNDWWASVRDGLSDLVNWIQGLFS